MIRYALLVLFVGMIGSRALGLDLGLAPGISIKNALLYATAALIAIDGATARNRRIELLPVIVPFALLILYAIASWIFLVVFLDYANYSPRETLIQLKLKLIDQFLVLLVFFYGAIQWKDVVWLLKAITWVVMFGCVVTVIDAFDIPDLGIVTARTTDGRVEGILGSAGEFSGLLAFFIPPMVALAWTEAGAARKFALAGAAFGLVSILIAATRGAMVGLVVGTIAAAIYNRRFISGQVLLRASVAIFLLVAFSTVLVLSTDFAVILEERLMTGLQAGDVQSISSGRTKFWMDALRDMADQPLSFITGLGWETYFQSVGRRYATHNVYLDRLYNLGLIGLILFTFSYASAIVIARRALDRASTEAMPYLMATVVGMLSFMLAMLFADLQGSATYVWAYSALALRIAVLSTEAAPTPGRGQRADTRRSLDQPNLATRPTSFTPRK
jgi:O-antigen ligase